MIPKKIHFIWVGGKIPEKYLKNILKVAALAKRDGFEFNLWVDKETNFHSAVEKLKAKGNNDPMATLVDIIEGNVQLKNINDLREGMRNDVFYTEDNRLRDFESILHREMVGFKNLAAASDLLRYEILRQYGGYYFDTDIVFKIEKDTVLKPDDPLCGFKINLTTTASFETVAGWRLNNNLIAATPHHKILENAIKQLMKRYKMLDQPAVTQKKDDQTYMDIKRAPAKEGFFTGGNILPLRMTLTLEASGPNVLMYGINEFLKTSTLDRETALQSMQGSSFMNVQVKGDVCDNTWKSVLLPPRKYDLALMSNNNLEKNVIEFKCEENESGITYRVIGLDNLEKTGLIPWNELPDGFPKNDKEIFTKKRILLPHLLEVTSKKGHTEFRKGLSFDDATIPNSLSMFHNQPHEDKKILKEKKSKKVDAAAKIEQTDLTNPDEHLWTLLLHAMANRKTQDLIKIFSENQISFSSFIPEQAIDVRYKLGDLFEQRMDLIGKLLNEIEAMEKITPNLRFAMKQLYWVTLLYHFKHMDIMNKNQTEKIKIVDQIVNSLNHLSDEDLLHSVASNPDGNDLFVHSILGDWLSYVTINNESFHGMASKDSKGNQVIYSNDYIDTLMEQLCKRNMDQSHPKFFHHLLCVQLMLNLSRSNIDGIIQVLLKMKNIDLSKEIVYCRGSIFDKITLLDALKNSPMFDKILEELTEHQMKPQIQQAIGQLTQPIQSSSGKDEIEESSIKSTPFQ